LIIFEISSEIYMGKGIAAIYEALGMSVRLAFSMGGQKLGLQGFSLFRGSQSRARGGDEVGYVW
jgi:hypothetical protein